MVLTWKTVREDNGKTRKQAVLTEKKLLALKVTWCLLRSQCSPKGKRCALEFPSLVAMDSIQLLGVAIMRGAAYPSLQYVPCVSIHGKDQKWGGLLWCKPLQMLRLRVCGEILTSPEHGNNGEWRTATPTNQLHSSVFNSFPIPLLVHNLLLCLLLRDEHISPTLTNSTNSDRNQSGFNRSSKARTVRAIFVMGSAVEDNRIAVEGSRSKNRSWAQISLSNTHN